LNSLNKETWNSEWKFINY